MDNKIEREIITAIQDMQAEQFRMKRMLSKVSDLEYAINEIKESIAGIKMDASLEEMKLRRLEDEFNESTGNTIKKLAHNKREITSLSDGVLKKELEICGMNEKISRLRVAVSKRNMAQLDHLKAAVGAAQKSAENPLTPVNAE